MTRVELLVVGAVVETVIFALDQLVKAGVEDVVAVMVTEGVGVVEDDRRFRSSSVVVMVVEDDVLGGLGGHVNEWNGSVE